MKAIRQVLLALQTCLIYNITFGLAEAEKGIYGNERRQVDYDYIIVGAGSSGAVIANRLSEDSNVTVLLLEAGGVPATISEIPLFVPQGIGLPESEWGYYTVPQNNACRGVDGKKSFWSRYKGLGGCSSHNHMIYNRGDPKDYDLWARSGATGWGWNDVLPLFKKSEDFIDIGRGDKGYHVTGGSLAVSFPRYNNRLRDAFLEAGKSLGYNTVDYNGASRIGFSSIQATQRDGHRCGTEKAFLRPAAERPNLDILIHATALRVKFDSGNRAREVVYEQQNQTRTATARREIILSAGAIGSAQLLMLSGIGPKDHLTELEISVVSDLPVGLNMQDHVTTGGLNWVMNDSVCIVFNRDIKEQAIADYLDGKGPLTSPGTVENLIHINSKFQNTSENWPDIQIETGSSLMLASLPEYDIKDVTTLLPIVARPKTRGVLKLQSNKPRDHPILDYQYFSEEEDLLILIEGMKFSRKMMKTPALQRYGPRPILEAVPQCRHLDWESDEYLSCVARTLTQTAFHPSGTVKMGATSDPTTVLDPELRVKGIKGLRVADASIMPFIVSGNLNAPCIMIGEKAAQMIQSTSQK